MINSTVQNNIASSLGNFLYMTSSGVVDGSENTIQNDDKISLAPATLLQVFDNFTINSIDCGAARKLYPSTTHKL